MRSRFSQIALFQLAAACAFGVVTANAHGQGTPMIQVESPFNSISNSFFERVGVDFGFELAGGRGPGSAVVGYNGFGITPNIVFRQNGVGSAVPPFGGFDPNSQARLGFSVRDSSGNALNFGIIGGKGMSRTLTNQTPSVTMMNGTTASVFDGTLQPFVTGIIPVLGQGPVRINPFSHPNLVPSGSRIANPLVSPVPRGSSYDLDPVAAQPVTYREADSSAQSGEISIAEIQANRANAQRADRHQLRQEIDQLLAKARQAELDNNTLAARSYYRKAFRKVGDDPQFADLRAEIQQRFSATGKKQTDQH